MYPSTCPLPFTCLLYGRITVELNALIQDGTPLEEIAKTKGVSVATVVNRWDVVRMRYPRAIGNPPE